jgi:Heterokaryon incompatibility protein (HET)
LRLLASPDLESGVRCEIFHVSLDQDADYSALSYVWGDPLITKTILMDGCKVNVTSNLESALRHLRKHDVDIRIWADALCINQSDVPEKSI